ncbi:MAG: pilus assembly protein CpaF [Magnetospirillum sp.]|nr:pilus assembly protein CpaF [Magnetospirillum sp.]
MIYGVSIDAFALTPDVADVFKAIRDDRVFAKSRVNVFPGGLAAAVGHYADKPTPQVILVEEEDDDATLLARIDHLAEVCEPGTRVVVVGKLNDIGLYRTLLARGVSDYLLSPVTPRQVASVLGAIFDDPSAPRKGRLVAVWGVRGGVGASTLAQNIAWETARATREDVIYIDLDIAFGTSGLAFNIDTKQTVADALGNPERLDQVLLERFLVAYDDHLQVLSSPGNPRAAQPIGVEALDKLLELALRMAPAVVVDLPHLWDVWTGHLLAAADEVLAVAVPDLVCLRDTKALVEALAGKRGDAIRLVLNRCDASRKTELSPRDFAEHLGLPPALKLPFDPALFGLAANNGQMLGETAKTHKVVELLGEFAVQLLGRAPAAKKPAAKSGFGASINAQSLLAWLKK